MMSFSDRAVRGNTRAGFGSRLYLALGLSLGLCLAGSASVMAGDIQGAEEMAGDALPEAARQALADGEALVIMRHALAPGISDPPGFRLDDCSTQRNLSSAGRTEAVRVGTMLRSWLPDDTDMEVYTSAWCRCRETATLLDVGPVEPFAALDSFFVERDRRADQTAELERWVRDRLAMPDAPPAVLVTHQVNISALTGEYTASGELHILSVDGAADTGADGQVPGRLRVLATQAVPLP